MTNELPSIEQQLSKAEERGYRRGLNEQLASKMNEPAVWENDQTPPSPPPPEFQILATLPRSIWDN